MTMMLKTMRKMTIMSMITVTMTIFGRFFKGVIMTIMMKINTMMKMVTEIKITTIMKILTKLKL